MSLGHNNSKQNAYINNDKKNIKEKYISYNLFNRDIAVHFTDSRLEALKYVDDRHTRKLLKNRYFFLVNSTNPNPNDAYVRQ